jgi:hypothetical protein
MTCATRKRSRKDLPVKAMTLAAVLAALDRPGKLPRPVNAISGRR